MTSSRYHLDDVPEMEDDAVDLLRYGVNRLTLRDTGQPLSELDSKTSTYDAATVHARRRRVLTKADSSSNAEGEPKANDWKLTESYANGSTDGPYFLTSPYRKRDRHYEEYDDGYESFGTSSYARSDNHAFGRINKSSDSDCDPISDGPVDPPPPQGNDASSHEGDGGSSRETESPYEGPAFPASDRPSTPEYIAPDETLGSTPYTPHENGDCEHSTDGNNAAREALQDVDPEEPVPSGQDEDDQSLVEDQRPDDLDFQRAGDFQHSAGGYGDNDTTGGFDALLGPPLRLPGVFPAFSVEGQRHPHDRAGTQIGDSGTVSGNCAPGVSQTHYGVSHTEEFAATTPTPKQSRLACPYKAFDPQLVCMKEHGRNREGGFGDLNKVK